MKGKWESTTAGELKLGDIWTHSKHGDKAKSAVYIVGEQEYLNIPPEVKGVCIWSPDPTDVGRVMGCSSTSGCFKLVG